MPQFYYTTLNLAVNKIVIAPNSFRQVIDSISLSNTIANAFDTIYGNTVSIKKCPYADGGDDSLKILASLLEIKTIQIETLNAKHEPIMANVGIYKKKAIIEASEVTGLKKISSHLNPLHSDSKGLGIVVDKLLDKGITEFVFLLGGSAVIDMGIGMYKYLGLKLFDSNKNIIPDGILNFNNVESVVNEIDERFLKSRVSVYCDITGSLFGNHNLENYFKQKGVTASQTIGVRLAIQNISNRLGNYFNTEIAYKKHTASNGGLAAQLNHFNNARLYSGSDVFSKLYKLESTIKESDIIVTGEGIFDLQSIHGKGAFLVAEIAKKHKKVLIGIVGKKADTNQFAKNNYFDLLIESPIDSFRTIKANEIRQIISNNILKKSSDILKLL